MTTINEYTGSLKDVQRTHTYSGLRWDESFSVQIIITHNTINKQFPFKYNLQSKHYIVVTFIW